MKVRDIKKACTFIQLILGLFLDELVKNNTKTLKRGNYG